jgi:hypothetical protein
METWDYGLWKANVQNRCYDLVTISGSFSVFGTALSMGGIVLYQRRAAYDGWDVKCFFLAGALSVAYILIQSETGNTMFPWAPLPTAPFRGESIFGWTVNRNYWFTDHKWLMATIVPLYAAPLFRAVYVDTFRPQNRIGRCSTQICMATLIGFTASVASSLAAWGSIWCFMTALNLIIMDVHVYLGNREKKDQILNPFFQKTVVRKKQS